MAPDTLASVRVETLVTVTRALTEARDEATVREVLREATAALPGEHDLLAALTELAATTLQRVRLITDLEHQVAQRTELMNRLTTTDELTGLANRRGFLDAAERARGIASRGGKDSVMLFIDIDDLKVVNDHHGHDHGDDLIVDTAALLRRTLRGVDVVGRWGGDEMVALLPDCADARAAAQRLDDAARAHPRTPVLSFSVGAVRVGPDDPRSLVALIAEADTQMYVVKQQRKSARV